MARGSGLTVVRRRLGSELRRLREYANIRIEQAARELECSPARVSRLENGLVIAKVWDVRILLQLYGVDDPQQRAEMERWAVESRKGGWWASDAELSEADLDRYLSLETEAGEAMVYAESVIPALVQTPAYAAAQIREYDSSLDADAVARLIRLRTVRQRAIARAESPLGLTLVIGEGALRREVGSAAVLQAQLGHVTALLDAFGQRPVRPLVVHVFPFSAGTPGRALSPFALFRPRLPDIDPVVGFAEQTHGFSWFEAPEDIAELKSIFDDLVDRCLDPQTSRALIRRLARPGAPDAGSIPKEG